MEQENIKSEFVKAYLDYKGLTEEEFIKIGKPLGDDYIDFIDTMADKYPGGRIDNRLKESDRFKEFVRNQVDFNPEYEVTYPKVIFSKEDVNFIKYRNENPIYSVEIANKDIGVTVCFTENIKEAKDIFDKEILFRDIQKKEDNILHKISNLDSIYGEGINKALIGADEMVGRREALIDYFYNELAHTSEYFLEGEEEPKEDYIEATEGIINELKNSKNSLESVYLFVSPMDGRFSIANNEDTLERFNEIEEEIKEAQIDIEEESEI